MAVQTRAGPLDLETGKAATVSIGRPDLTRLIVQAVSEHPQEKYVGIIASGMSLDNHVSVSLLWKH